MSRLARLPGAVAADSPTFSPLYRQIKVLLTRGLQAGEWKPGELIPSDEVRATAAGLIATEPWGREQWERLAEGTLFDGM